MVCGVATILIGHAAQSFANGILLALIVVIGVSLVATIVLIRALWLIYVGRKKGLTPQQAGRARRLGVYLLTMSGVSFVIWMANGARTSGDDVRFVLLLLAVGAVGAWSLHNGRRESQTNEPDA